MIEIVNETYFMEIFMRENCKYFKDEMLESIYDHLVTLAIYDQQ